MCFFWSVCRCLKAEAERDLPSHNGILGADRKYLNQKILFLSFDRRLIASDGVGWFCLGGLSHLYVVPKHNISTFLYPEGDARPRSRVESSSGKKKPFTQLGLFVLLDLLVLGSCSLKILRGGLYSFATHLWPNRAAAHRQQTYIPLVCIHKKRVIERGLASSEGDFPPDLKILGQ